MIKLKNLKLYISHPIKYFTILKKRVCSKILGMIIYRKKIRKRMLYFGEDREKKIIVSLTSFPDRFDSVVLAIKSIMFGSLKPDKIELYLSQDEVSNIDDLPISLKKLQKVGLDIYIVKDNLKSHKKYYYSMKKHPNDLIITIDDDVLYPRDLVRSLYKSYLKYPNFVSARRVHAMLKEDETLYPYEKWKFESKNIKKPELCLFPTGVGGVLYPPHCMTEELFNIDDIKKYCINADDVWLKAMQLKKGTKVVWVKNNEVLPPAIVGSQKIHLSSENVSQNFGEGMNNIYIENMKNYLDVDFKDYALELNDFFKYK